MQLKDISASCDISVAEYQLDEELLNALRLPASLAKILEQEAKHQIEFEQMYIEVVLACYETVMNELAITAQKEACAEVSQSGNPLAAMLGVVEGCPQFYANCIRRVPARVAKQLSFELSPNFTSFAQRWAGNWQAMLSN